MIPSSLLRLDAWGVLSVAVVLLLTTGCSDESLLEPEATNQRFDRYVALGNSITAGFQSGGIVDSTQENSYAVLLADQMNTRFEIPRLAPKGCPPPADGLLSLLLNQGGDPSCDFRSSPTPTVLNNVAVPGAKVIDALSNTSDDSTPNELTTFLLGGRTQVEVATEINPTFASVWLGNNDALVAALTGDADQLLTDADQFESRITRVVDSLTKAGAQHGILISVAKPTFAPNFSTGQAYANAESTINDVGSSLSPEWGEFTVNQSCSNGGASTRIPFQYGFGELIRDALNGASVELNCAPNTAAPEVLTPSEQETISNRVEAFNTTIEALASENDWAYLDINPILKSLYEANADDADPTNDLVPKFPNLQTITGNSEDSNGPFGRYFSNDGVHPSSVTHRAVSYLIIERLNDRYEDVDLDQVTIPQEIEALL